MEKSHHRRFKIETSGDEYASPTVGALITNGFTTSGDGPSHHHRLKSNASQTGGDAHFEPAVMGDVVVVLSLFE